MIAAVTRPAMRRPRGMNRVLVWAVLGIAGALAGCGGDGGAAGDGPVVADAGPIHVHGLGVNPRDNALFIATHTGLFRAAKGESEATRVADRYQDTMGFTVVGPDHFLGSGHPDAREDLPPFLGLIESTDGGVTWDPVSLFGEQDFHVLEAQGSRVYGFGADFQTQKLALLVSDDGGETWSERGPPEPLIALAIDPRDPDHVVASAERRLYESSDAGESWQRLEGEPGLLSWPSVERLYVATPRGAVQLSEDSAGSWRTAGEVEGRPAAFEATSADDLYVALHDGTVKQSVDGGRSWAVRSTP